MNTSVSPATTELPTSFEYEGFRFVKRGTDTNNSKTYYRCAKYRQSCSCTLHVFHNVMRVQVFGGHSCNTPTIANVVDISEQSFVFIDNLSINHPEMTASTLVQQYREWCTNTYDRAAYNPLSTDVITNRVYNTRRAHFHISSFNVFETIPLINCSQQDLRLLLTFNISFRTGENTLERIVCWSSPSLLRMLRYNTHAYVDCTFKCVPADISQLIIVMIFDPASQLYLPICYGLLTSKKKELYWRFIHELKMTTDNTWNPVSVTCDFEYALLQSISSHFGIQRVIGCLFHFKQAIRRKLKSSGIDNEIVSYLMKPGVLDVLTVIPADEILTKGIRFVQHKLKERFGNKDDVKLNVFWMYFKNTWTNLFSVQFWNIHDKNELMNRTNNALESYNRRFNDLFATAHPSLQQLIIAIQGEVKRIEAKIDDIKAGRMSSGTHKQLPLHVPTSEYESFNGQ